MVPIKSEICLYKAGKIFKNSQTLVSDGSLYSVDNILRDMPSEQDKRESSLPVIDFKKSIITPIFMNAHTHIQYKKLVNTVFSDFSSWVLQLVQENITCTEESIYQTACHNLQDIVQSGTTIIYEASRHPIPVAKAINKIGIRANLSIEIFSHSSTSVEQAFQNILTTYGQVKDFLNNDSCIGFSPHSLYNMNIDLWKRLAQYCLKHNILIHTHLLESEEEVKFFKTGYSSIDKIHQYFSIPKQNFRINNMSPVTFLEQEGLLNPLLLATHLCYADEQDIITLVKSGVTMNHCPRSNKFLGHKPMLLRSFLDAGGTVLLGTDSLASNQDLSIIEELLAIEEPLKDQEILKLLCENPAALFSAHSVTGTLDSGSETSFLVFDDGGEGSLKDILSQHKKPKHVVDRGKFIVKDYKLMIPNLPF